MQNFIRTITLDDTLTDLFLSFLLSEKYQVPSISKNQERLVSQISGSFLMSGFLLRSCDFNASHKNLIELLKYQRKAQLLKQMLVKRDLENIARNFNEKGIKHTVLKGVALNLDGIYPNGTRSSRDVDLLVSSDSLSEAYDVLKILGFNYLNQNTQDSIKYNHYGHHFPPMINENKTILELHWRVTPSRDFKICPLTENVLANRRVSNTNPEIFCPKIETTLTHILYHGLVHHRMNLGPIFLFDLAAIFSFHKKNWPVDTNLLKSLGVAKRFDLCKKLIELASNEPSFSRESKTIINQLFKNSHWLRISDDSRVPSFLVEYKYVKKDSIFSKLIVKARKVRHSHQVSYWSLKFWLFLITDILGFLKKVFRGHFN